MMRFGAWCFVNTSFPFFNKKDIDEFIRDLCNFCQNVQFVFLCSIQLLMFWSSVNHNSLRTVQGSTSIRISVVIFTITGLYLLNVQLEIMCSLLDQKISKFLGKQNVNFYKLWSWMFFIIIEIKWSRSCFLCVTCVDKLTFRDHSSISLLHFLCWPVSSTDMCSMEQFSTGFVEFLERKQTLFS